MNVWFLMLLMVVLASLLECMARIKNYYKSLNHLIIHDHNPNNVCSKMSCRHFERLLCHSTSTTLAVRGRGRGCGRGRGVNPIAFNLVEDTPPARAPQVGVARGTNKSTPSVPRVAAM